MAKTLVWLIAAVLMTPPLAAAQERLSLEEAVRRAREHNAAVQSASLAAREAATGVDQARASWLPRVDLIESWQRSNLPVFAFSSLLSQRRFTEQDFDVSRLNHPDPLDAFRAAISVEQPVFDGTLRPRVQSARLGHEAAQLRRQQVEHDSAQAAADGYGRVLLLEALADAARAAVDAAAGDVRRARDRQEIGTATAADVLSLEVHAAAMRERDIETRAEARIARARLNDVIGAPLDTPFALDSETTAVTGLLPPIEALEREALTARSDVRLSAIDERGAATTVAAVRAAFLPQVTFRSGWEWNGGTFGMRETGWLIGADVRLNLFRGLGDRARLQAARIAADRQTVDRARIENAARLDVRAAVARLEAADARRTVAEAIVSHAEESQRITRDRYEHGLSDVTALLRSAQAVLDAKAQQIGARVDLMVCRAALDRALGR